MPINHWIILPSTNQSYAGKMLPIRNSGQVYSKKWLFYESFLSTLSGTHQWTSCPVDIEMEFLSSHARWSSLIMKKQNIWNRFKFFYDKYPIFIHWRKNRVDKMTYTFSSFWKIPANTCIISTFSLSFWTRCGRTCPKQSGEPRCFRFSIFEE